jgi:hypothetical protein
VGPVLPRILCEMVEKILSRHLSTVRRPID